jgi:septal ring factor EnvC (AmiA/AmiB activator)
MEYNRIQSLVPKDEHFDATAVNEGVWVSKAHLDAIENQLGQDQATIESHGPAVQGLTDQITTLTTERDSAKTELQTANDTVAARDSKITEMQSEIDGLKKGPGAQPEQTSREKDELGATENAAYSSDKDPFFQFANNAFGFAKK